MAIVSKLANLLKPKGNRAKRPVRFFSRIARSVEAKGNSVYKLDFGFTQKGARRKGFVLKRTRFYEGSSVEDWKQIHQKLRELRIPTSPIFEVTPTKKANEVTIKQKDYTMGGRLITADAWRIHISPGTENAFMGIVRDIALMHKNGISFSPQQSLTAPWIIYRRADGKIDRAIVDFGTIRMTAPRSSIETNFETMLPWFRGMNGKITDRALKVYFQANPDSKLKLEAAKFFRKTIE